MKHEAQQVLASGAQPANVPGTKSMVDRPHPKNVSVLLRSEGSRIELGSALKDIADIDLYLLMRPQSMMGPFGRGQTLPDVLLIEVDASDPVELNYIKTLKSGLPHTPIVALMDGTKHLSALSAIRAGADDVVGTPINPHDLLEVLARVARPAGALLASNVGRLIAFVHVAGGTGATTLAVNSAAAIAQFGKADGVCLIDLDVQYGNAASLLDIQKVSPVDTLIDEPGRLDREMLDDLVVAHESGVSVLTAPRLPFALGSYRSDMVANLVHLAKRRYAITIVDLPVALAPSTDVVLREAAFVFIVCTPSVAAVHRVVQFMRLMEQEQLGHLPFRVVLNRYNSSGVDISAQRFAKAIGRPVEYTIDNDYGLVSASHNHGKPAVNLKPTSRFAQQLTSMLSAELGAIVEPGRRPWWQLKGS